MKDGPLNSRINVSKILDIQPKSLTRSKYGNPSSYIVNGKRYYILKTARGYAKRGIASWYGTKFHGQLTSIREPYNMLAMTGASPVLPIPCFVRVTNLNNNRSVIIKINDRGPFTSNRIIDLSYAAAKKLDYVNKGTALVYVKAITFNHHHISGHRTMLATVPSTHSQKLFLQLGAFYKFSHAKNLKIQLHDYIKNPILILKNIYCNYLPLYCVQIGPLQDISASNYLQKKLKKLGFREIVIIVN
ncbi:septal ring lytic transglycosylase RlpA family protein [Coxiella endosymbiont of Amblyomma nuttalli]|uniref:septal ring lytic transglycosylase RlpA family protein n=1 Tax=Coxiella endosymbiont of Amblyomma nuttalli TaxID=2749996 RepID=UPI001FD0B0BF|nr:septal ring lytic transglycosylase RlpA family protein [Coxiella endosymbiont of Amblyomma nuttalli]